MHATWKLRKRRLRHLLDTLPEQLERLTSGEHDKRNPLARKIRAGMRFPPHALRDLQSLSRVRVRILRNC